jgi:hypothetical protein
MASADVVTANAKAAKAINRIMSVLPGFAKKTMSSTTQLKLATRDLDADQRKEISLFAGRAARSSAPRRPCGVRVGENVSR